MSPMLPPPRLRSSSPVPQCKSGSQTPASSYERAVEELDAARATRDKFVAACTKHMPATSLPPSLQLKLVVRAKLTPVAG